MLNIKKTFLVLIAPHKHVLIDYKTFLNMFIDGVVLALGYVA